MIEQSPQKFMRELLASAATQKEITEVNTLHGLNLKYGITRRELLDAVAQHVKQEEST